MARGSDKPSTRRQDAIGGSAKADAGKSNEPDEARQSAEIRRKRQKTGFHVRALCGSHGFPSYTFHGVFPALSTVIPVLPQVLAHYDMAMKKSEPLS
ncbi:MAG: hypothetical protein ABIK28_16890 [Planctomycetota bacterium]